MAIIVSIDVETFSEEDIKKGVYAYTRHRSFLLLIICYWIEGTDRIIRIDMEKVRVGDYFELQKLDFFTLLLDNPKYEKRAYNAQFEINALREGLDIPIDVSQWFCTMAHGVMVGLPFGLDAAAKAAGLPVGKDKRGKELIKLFSIPDKYGQRSLPRDYPDEWQEFIEYCAQDVRTEIGVQQFAKWYQICDFEKPVYALDQKINEKGMMIDKQYLDNAIALNELITTEIYDYLQEKTGLDNPNSGPQFKKWLELHTGVKFKSLAKDVLPDVIAEIEKLAESDPTIGHVAELIRLKAQLGKASIKKFYTVKELLMKDHRIRGQILYYGASQTGRFAGRGFQPHNISRGTLPAEELIICRELIRDRKFETLRLMYDDITEVLSSAVRPVIVPAEGKVLIGSDLAQIEARVIAWYAGEQWVLDAFQRGEDLYKVTAARMFGKPVDEITKEDRAKGKIAVLANGFGGGKGSLERMNKSTHAGIDPKLFRSIVKGYREANPNIKQLWYDMHDAAVNCIYTGQQRELHGLTVFKHEKNLCIRLVTGRVLVYPGAYVAKKVIVVDVEDEITGEVIGKKEIETDAIFFKTISEVTGQPITQSTYGATLAQNVTQATARDVLVHKMLELDKTGYDIVLHVHDEVVIEAARFVAKAHQEYIHEIMSADVPFMPGLPVGADTEILNFYRK